MENIGQSILINLSAEPAQPVRPSQNIGGKEEAGRESDQNFSDQFAFVQADDNPNTRTPSSQKDRLSITETAAKGTVDASGSFALTNSSESTLGASSLNKNYGQGVNSLSADKGASLVGKEIINTAGVSTLKESANTSLNNNVAPNFQNEAANSATKIEQTRGSIGDADHSSITQANGNFSEVPIETVKAVQGKSTDDNTVAITTKLSTAKTQLSVANAASTSDPQVEVNSRQQGTVLTQEQTASQSSHNATSLSNINTAQNVTNIIGPSSATQLDKSTGAASEELADILDTDMPLEIERFADQPRKFNGAVYQASSTLKNSQQIFNASIQAQAVTSAALTASSYDGVGIADYGMSSSSISASGVDPATSPVLIPQTQAQSVAAWSQVITAIADRQGDAKIELRLNPPELGRVVIGFEGDGADIIRAVVTADAPETLDLMRRNLDILERELSRAGLEHVDVQLNDREASDHYDTDEIDQIANAFGDDSDDELAFVSPPIGPIVSDGRLDLRV